MSGRAYVGSVVLDRARRGDREAFVALVRLHDHGLRALAYRMLGDRGRMDDALQESYLRAFRALPGFRGTSDVGTWLYRIVYNACVDELARTRPAREVELGDADETWEPAADPLETVARRSALADALAELVPEDRAAVLLVDAQGFDYAGAAAVLGVPVGTVASRLNRARRALRRVLAQQLEGVLEP